MAKKSPLPGHSQQAMENTVSQRFHLFCHQTNHEYEDMAHLDEAGHSMFYDCRLNNNLAHDLNLGQIHQAAPYSANSWDD